jgi:hypothetical protein
MRSSRRKAANSLAPRSPPFAFHRVFPLVTGVPTGEDLPETCPPRACVSTWSTFRLAVRQRHREWAALAFPPTVLCVVAVTEEAASATAVVHLFADRTDLIEAVTDLRWLEWGHAPEPIDRDWWHAATVREAGRSGLPMTRVRATRVERRRGRSRSVRHRETPRPLTVGAGHDRSARPSRSRYRTASARAP